MNRVILLRHGLSLWNEENRFTGWVDIDLAQQGIQEACQAGQLLQKTGLTFDVAYTSVLKRAIRSLWLILETLDTMWLPVLSHWALNERHYGQLQGLNKAEVQKQYGQSQVHIWRRSYKTHPPLLEKSELPDARYRDLPLLPRGESLEDTVNRVIPYWQNTIVPTIKAGKQVIIVAHGNSLRALIKHLDHLSDEAIMQCEIPTGTPLVYELDNHLEATQHYFLQK